MIVFADTSGLFALLVKNDFWHVRAKKVFSVFAADNTMLLTSSYVLVETMALLQRRVGMDAVLDFQDRILPLLEVVWVDRHWQEKGMHRLIALGAKG